MTIRKNKRDSRVITKKKPRAKVRKKVSFEEEVVEKKVPKKKKPKKRFPKIPKPPEQRGCTDILGLILYIACGATTLGLIGYCIAHCDLYGLFAEEDIVEFFGMYLIQDVTSNIIPIGMCIWFSMVISVFLTVVVQWLSEMIVAALAIAGTVTMSSLCILFWIKCAAHHNHKADLAAACFLTTCFVMWILFLIVVAKEIHLIIWLYGQASRVIRLMPQLVFYALVIYFFELAVIFTFCAVFCVITSSVINDRDSIEDGILKYIDIKLALAYAFSTLMVVWTIFYLSSFRIFVVAHAAATWYFQKDKNKPLKSPILTGLFILLRYHLGTIGVSSFLMSYLQIFKSFLYGIRKFSEGGLCRKFMCLVITFPIRITEPFWTLISSHSIYITVLYGLGYYRGLRRANELLDFTNSMFVYMLIDMMRVICVFLVFTTAILIACLTMKDDDFIDNWRIYSVFFILCFSIPVMIMSVYKNITQSIFMCLCLEMERYNGKISKSPNIPSALKLYIKGIKESECDLIV